MRVVSLFSGVGGFDLGLERAGMTTVAQVEWDAKCQQVLARHWPDVPRWGDVSDVRGGDLPDCDLVAFGSPCQDLSVAGKRAGMVEGETRSGLFYEAIRIIKELQDERRGPAWVVWENVVGALSSNGGRDFGAVLDSLADIGAVDIQWRVLDAQWFGVPQRRRRVFVVARLDPGAAGRPEVLPVGASVRRDSPSSSEAGKGAPARPAGCLGLGAGKTDELDGHGAHVVVGPDGKQIPTPVGRVGMTDDDGQAGHLIPCGIDLLNETTTGDVMPTVRGGAGGGNTMPHAMLPVLTGTVTTTWAKRPGNTQVEEGHVIPVMAFGWQENRTAGTVWQDEVPGLTTTKTDAVAIAENQRGEVRTSDVVPSISDGGGKPGQGYPAVLAPTLTAYNLDSRSPQSEEQQRIVRAVHEAEGGSLAVRRLTPRECERLMGWPDDWTRWTADGTEVADSHRYRMCGNGVASPAAAWAGRCTMEGDR